MRIVSHILGECMRGVFRLVEGTSRSRLINVSGVSRGTAWNRNAHLYVFVHGEFGCLIDREGAVVVVK